MKINKSIAQLLDLVATIQMKLINNKKTNSKNKKFNIYKKRLN